MLAGSSFVELSSYLAVPEPVGANLSLSMNPANTIVPVPNNPLSSGPAHPSRPARASSRGSDPLHKQQPASAYAATSSKRPHAAHKCQLPAFSLHDSSYPAAPRPTQMVASLCLPGAPPRVLPCALLVET